MRFTAFLALLLPLLTCAIVVGQTGAAYPRPTPVAPAFSPAPPTGFPVPSAGGFAASASPQAYLGTDIQPFDPYALPGNMGTFGAMPGSGYPTGPLLPPGSLSTTPSGISPSWQQPGVNGIGPTSPVPGSGAPAGITAPPGVGTPGFASPYGQPTPWTRPVAPAPGAAPSTDPYYRGSPYAATSNYGYNTTAAPPYQRLFQDTGLRATYLHGEQHDDLQLTEVEASTTAYLANFMGIPHGLRVTPGFAFHWTDGPQGPTFPHVPGRLYSGYVDLGLEPKFSQYFGAELSARIGIYSDFQAFNEDSIRLLGTAVGVFQTTPTVSLKLGAAYIDRVRIKLLPAAGILWTPNPQTRWDVFFPAPKLSNYWTTIGNRQVWWYLGGEYGGGSWSIERETSPPRTDRIDINDVRIYVGVEWWSLNRYYAFLELGYVFDREVVFYRVPGDTENLDDTFMVRGGVSW